MSIIKEKCAVLFDRAKLQELLDKVKEKSEINNDGNRGPRGIVFRVKKPTSKKKSASKKTIIEPNTIQVLGTWFNVKEKKMEGFISNIEVCAKDIIRVKKKKRNRKRSPIWEYSDTLSKVTFNFSFFHYNTLDVILNLIGSESKDEKAYDKVLLGSIGSKVGRAKKDNTSAVRGEVFAFKIEPYRSPDSGEPFTDLEPLGVPFFAFGLSCQYDWYKNTGDWMKKFIKKSSKKFVNEIMEIEDYE